MPIIAKKPESTFEPCPEGLHLACCCDVVDLGIQNTTWGDKHKIQIRWQVEEANSAGRRFEVRKQYTNSLHEKAQLRKDLESWRGRKFTDEELMGFDLEKLLSANCQLQVIHNIGENGSVYANVQAIVPAPKGVPRMMSTDYVRQQDREQQGHNGRREEEYGSVPF